MFFVTKQNVTLSNVSLNKSACWKKINKDFFVTVSPSYSSGEKLFTNLFKKSVHSLFHNILDLKSWSKESNPASRKSKVMSP